MTKLTTLLTILTALGGIAWAQPTSEARDPVLEEFKKYIRSPEPEVRRDQVERLARVNSPAAVALILKSGLTDKDYAVREKAQWALSRMTGEARAAVTAALDGGKADVREGVCLAIGAMKDWTAEPPIARLGALLKSDRSELVRAAAAEAILVQQGKGRERLTRFEARSF